VFVVLHKAFVELNTVMFLPLKLVSTLMVLNVQIPLTDVLLVLLFVLLVKSLVTEPVTILQFRVVSTLILFVISVMVSAVLNVTMSKMRTVISPLVLSVLLLEIMCVLKELFHVPRQPRQLVVMNVKC